MIPFDVACFLRIVAVPLAAGAEPGAAASALPSILITLPGKTERELATELVVLSLGPLSTWTTGPLGLTVVCDGEQVLSAEVEAGYARRGVAEGMCSATWRSAADLALALDPLAPVAGRLAYVQGLEALQQWQAPAMVVAWRTALLALERAQNQLWWLVRFCTALAAARLAARIHALASRLATLAAHATTQVMPWLVPQGTAGPPLFEGSPAVEQLRQIVNELGVLRARIARDLLLRLRTQGIGQLSVEQLQAVGASGPVLAASQRGAGDVQSRLLARLDAAIDDLRAALALPPVAADDQPTPQWQAPAGDVQVGVSGPRGWIGLRLVSDGGTTPARVEWERPSAALLPLLPALLMGQKLADAEVIVGSLDLAMAEADG